MKRGELIKVYTTVHSAEDVKDHLGKFKCFEKEGLVQGGKYGRLRDLCLQK